MKIPFTNKRIGRKKKAPVNKELLQAEEELIAAIKEAEKHVPKEPPKNEEHETKDRYRSEKAIVFQETPNMIQVVYKKIKINANIDPVYFVHKRMRYPCYYQDLKGNYHNLYDGHDSKKYPFVTNKDTSDFEAIYSICDSLNKNKLYDRFWSAIFKLNNALGKWDYLIFTLGNFFFVAIIEFFKSGGFPS